MCIVTCVLVDSPLVVIVWYLYRWQRRRPSHRAISAWSSLTTSAQRVVRLKASFKLFAWFCCTVNACPVIMHQAPFSVVFRRHSSSALFVTSPTRPYLEYFVVADFILWSALFVSISQVSCLISPLYSSSVLFIVRTFTPEVSCLSPRSPYISSGMWLDW